MFNSFYHSIQIVSRLVCTERRLRWNHNGLCCGFHNVLCCGFLMRFLFNPVPISVSYLIITLECKSLWERLQGLHPTPDSHTLLEICPTEISGGFSFAWQKMCLPCPPARNCLLISPTWSLGQSVCSASLLPFLLWAARWASDIETRGKEGRRENVGLLGREIDRTDGYWAPRTFHRPVRRATIQFRLRY